MVSRFQEERKNSILKRSRAVNLKNRILNFPALVVFIEHSTFGNILYDTGYSDAIYKNGIVAKCTAEINGCLVLDNILITEKSKYIQTPCDVYEKNGEKKYKPHYFFIVKGVPADFGNFIIEQLEKHS